LDARTPGELGVYNKTTGERAALHYQSERPWYLASTVKIPVAIAVLQRVEDGDLALDDKLTLKASDYVDGSGDLLWQEPGTRVSIRSLLEKMLVNSDSTATDMLIRRLGEEALNAQIHDRMDVSGFGPITTLLQVRYDAYGELHPAVKRLRNMDFIELKASPFPDERLQTLLSKLGVTAATLQSAGIPEAFEKYYALRRNSAPLQSFGRLLERLNAGELLSPTHTNFMLGLMEKMVTGEKRLKAGLPPHVRFAQKTGTQHGRICNVGLIHTESQAHVSGDRAVVVAACAEKFGQQREAEAALAAVGEALAKHHPYLQRKSLNAHAGN
jgi:beta-lactamase class A